MNTTFGYAAAVRHAVERGFDMDDWFWVARRALREKEPPTSSMTHKQYICRPSYAIFSAQDKQSSDTREYYLIKDKFERAEREAQIAAKAARIKLFGGEA